MVKDSILDVLSGYREDMARFTGELVGIPTENPPGRSYRDCVEAIAAELGRLGLTYRIHEVGAEDSQSSLPRFWLESHTGEGDRVLYFHGHYDVVPAFREDQFSPRIADGKLYGRGSSDMKGGLTAGIDLDVETLQEGSCTGVSEDSALGQALSASIEEVTGKPARFEMCPGLLETRFYADRGVPALAYGPGLLSVSHGPNEFIEIDDIVSSAAVYSLTAVRLLTAD